MRPFGRTVARACTTAILSGVLWAEIAYAQQLTTVVGQVLQYAPYATGETAKAPAVGHALVDISNEADGSRLGIVGTDKHGCWSLGGVASDLRIAVSVVWRGPQPPEYLEIEPERGAAMKFARQCGAQQIVVNGLYHPDRLVDDLNTMAGRQVKSAHVAANASACASMKMIDRAKCFETGAGRSIRESNAQAITNARRLWERGFLVHRNVAHVIGSARFEIDLGQVCRSAALLASIEGTAIPSIYEKYDGQVSVQRLESAYACLGLEWWQTGARVPISVNSLVEFQGLAQRLISPRGKTDPERKGNDWLLENWLVSYLFITGDEKLETAATSILSSAALRATWQKFREHYSQRIQQIDDATEAKALAALLHKAAGELNSKK
jgi:hypothetical protein